MTACFTWDELRQVCDGEWLCPPSADEGICGIVTDSRQSADGAAFLALVGERFDGHDFVDTAAKSGAAAIVVERPVECAECATLLVPETLRAYQALAHHHRLRFPDAHVIGITGSSGKTSSRTIIAAVLRAAFGEDKVLATEGNTNNQIGVPQNLMRLTAEHTCAVLEMGTNEPGEIAILREIVQPQVAVLTNVGPVHLAGLGSLDGVAREKSCIFDDTDLAVLPRQFAANPIVSASLPPKRVLTGFDEECDIRIEYVGSDLRSSRFMAHAWGETLAISWPLRGKHMATNAAAAIAVAKYLDIPMPDVALALASCPAPKMRMQTLERKGRVWINDAYNANPDSMKALIDWLAESCSDLIVILGDMLELGPEENRLHCETLTYATEQLPNATVVGFGPRMVLAAGSCGMRAFADIDSLRQWLESGDRMQTPVALKGSRGMALERLLPPE